MIDALLLDVSKRINEHREIPCFEIGMSPLEVISAATILNARYLRTEQRLGSIEPGKLADLILIKGDPTINITSMYNVEHVMQNGKWIKRTETPN